MVSNFTLTSLSKNMSISGEIIRPIVGLSTNQFIPLSTDFEWGMEFFFLLLQTLTLLFWSILFAAFIKDRHYEDPTSLLIISFGLADVLFAATCLHSSITVVSDKGYNRGYIGNTGYTRRFLIIISYYI